MEKLRNEDDETKLKKQKRMQDYNSTTFSSPVNPPVHAASRCTVVCDSAACY